MSILHPQEKIINAFSWRGITAELVEWTESCWCGKIGYAENNSDEPDVGAVMDAFFAADAPAGGREENWDVCISFNYLSGERPNGVMFGFYVGTEVQPECFDVVKLPPALYMRVQICDETAAALGCEPWKGGVPPYEWITERIAPDCGYRAGDDALPVFEYYGFYDPEKNEHKYCFLYVPVAPAS